MQQRIMNNLLLLLSALLLLVSAQNVPIPHRLNIPGAVPIPLRPQFRNEKLVRARRPNAALRAQDFNVYHPITPRIIDDRKPVTESGEEETPDVFLPTLLREQQLAQAQQEQFQQTAAQFLNGVANSIQQDALGLQLASEEQHTPTSPVARIAVERPTVANNNNNNNNNRQQINDFAIGVNSGVQRYGLERPQPINQPIAGTRTNAVRARTSVREPRPQYETQSLSERNPPPQPPPQQATRPRPAKPLQSRPIEQNVLSEERAETHTKRQRPVAQTLRKWREENEDGSITWGYENDDGSFKEEIIGTDCITKGTYGYIDPDGNKREYHYETGILCDPNTRQSQQELQENGFVNYEENKAVLPNGIEIDMSQLGKKKSNRPGAVLREPQPAQVPQNQYYRN